MESAVFRMFGELGTILFLRDVTASHASLRDIPIYVFVPSFAMGKGDGEGSCEANILPLPPLQNWTQGA